jgi:NADH-quinone oxidoreductase subunit N
MWLSNSYIKQSSSSLIELPLLFLVAVTLLLIINSLTDIFAIVLSFEILSLIIIGLCGLTMNKISTEASIKYFCQNSIITGLVLIGVFFYLFIFKNTNLLVTKLFIEIILNFSLATYCLNVLLFTSIILWLFSFFFKFGIFPVNFYVADIYNGSSAPVILFISAIIKPTILFLFYIRIIPIFSEKIILISIICSFCLSSIIIGDWMSLNSSDIKRFFGHSSISQYGFIVLSLFSKSIDIAFYAFLYLFIYNVSFFLIITILVEQYNYKLNDISKLYFNDLNSYFKNNLSAKLLMTVNILLISGLPPFILFLYKYAIFVQIFGSKNYIFLLLIFIFNTGFSSAYYFRIISDIWAINLLNINLVNLAEKKNLIFESNIIINDRLKIYIFWLLLIFFYFFLIKYFDMLYSFGVLVILDNLL